MRAVLITSVLSQRTQAPSGVLIVSVVGTEFWASIAIRVVAGARGVYAAVRDVALTAGNSVAQIDFICSLPLVLPARLEQDRAL